MTDAHAAGVLVEHRLLWKQKPFLRRVYNEELFSRLLANRVPSGVSLEVGAGPGFFKEMFPSVIATDLIPCPWLDAAVDAQRLPFANGAISNILGLDMLHHMASPLLFLRECERVLAPGGRLLLVEPWITPFSYLVYRYLHQEDCDLSVNLWSSSVCAPAAKRAFEGNQAIPYLLYGPHGKGRAIREVPRLRPIVIEPFCLFAYLLSFGFKPVNLLPESLYRPVAAFERITKPLWRRLAALRVLLVLERVS